MALDATAFDQWLAAYGRAWEARDSRAAVALFGEDARYHWTPFDDPKRGLAEIASAWEQATGRQAHVHFEYEILGLVGDRGVARWRTRFTRVAAGRTVRLDGILLATFDDHIRCLEFREWWHSDEGPGPQEQVA